MGGEEPGSSAQGPQPALWPCVHVAPASSSGVGWGRSAGCFKARRGGPIPGPGSAVQGNSRHLWRRHRGSCPPATGPCTPKHLQNQAGCCGVLTVKQGWLGSCQAPLLGPRQKGRTQEALLTGNGRDELSQEDANSPAGSAWGPQARSWNSPCVRVGLSGSHPMEFSRFRSCSRRRLPSPDEHPSLRESGGRVSPRCWREEVPLPLRWGQWARGRWASIHATPGSPHRATASWKPHKSPSKGSSVAPNYQLFAEMERGVNSGTWVIPANASMQVRPPKIHNVCHSFDGLRAPDWDG